MRLETTALDIRKGVLDNGLRVVVGPDPSTSLVAIAVVYDVGFRSEPEGRTGFAHLFEHLMFEGSQNVGKMEHARLIQAAGGVMNGHTRADLTAYYEALPADGLELALWLEADRMAALALNEENLKNQVAVVEEEIRVNVLNRPYGGFPWILLPQVAFDTYPNAHNGYGDFSHLEQATLEDAASFFERYYSPANAVLAVAGACGFEEVMELAQRHFGSIPNRGVPERPSFSEPLPAEARRSQVEDRLAPLPAFVLGWRAPDPVGDLKGFVALSVAGAVLAHGDASRLRHRLVHKERRATDVACFSGPFGDGITMRDPVLFQTVVFHPPAFGADQLAEEVVEEVASLGASGPSDDELERVVASAKADHWRLVDQVLQRALSMADFEVIHQRAELVAELPAIWSALSQADVAKAAERLVEQNSVLLELKAGAQR